MKRSFATLLLLVSLSGLSSAQWQPAESPMMTRWGKEVTPENAWTEYPRPQFRREETWTNLNGLWQYAVTNSDESTNSNAAPEEFDGQILVPYPIESALSGVGHLLEPDEVLWYRRTLEHQAPENHRTLLHFEAVDYDTLVTINGEEVGRHTGGSDPFTFDITDHLTGGQDELVVRVIDKTAPTQLRGKQTLNPEGIYYTRVSGIWQTVWLEDVPQRHIAMTKMKPRIEEGTLRVLPTLAGPPIEGEKLRVTVRDGEQVVGTADAALSVRIPDAKLWTPKSPHLYDITIDLLDGNGQVVDSVESYAAMREFGVRRDADGHLRMTLNGDVIFHYGTLDQGWWPDGLLTPPSDEAMRYDVDFLKKAGFNTIRKHVKVEPRRFYAYCDRVGMLVWQDLPSAGDHPEWTRLAPNPPELDLSKQRHEQFMSELKGLVTHLRNHPSIAMWVPFNERWGQHETVQVARAMENLDVRRYLNIASGGNFFPVGDVVDHHSYPEPMFPLDDARLDDYVKVVGEFGGHGFVVEGHLWNPEMRNWGYGDLPKTREAYQQRYVNSFEKLMQLRRRGVAGGIYTQTTDVEGEVNGLMTYDREVKKIPAEELAKLHGKADFSRAAEQR